jgi:A/G-specific adenine glycosylase
VSSHHSDVLAWFDQKKREMPWRTNPNPYWVWVSEIMLQQTQVSVVIPFFERWMQRFPDVETLAYANIDEVLAHWSGLGYYRRARNLHSGAVWICENGFPSTAKEWLSVPGVGRYTAGAIASIALDERTALVDGNVERVFARLENSLLQNPALNRITWSWAEASLPESRVGDWNQALMELGATICTPKNPDCSACPLQTMCKSYEEGVERERPVKSEKRRFVELTRYASVIERNGTFALIRIPRGEWWEGMWMFPTSNSAPQGRQIATIKHTVTHHKLTFELWLTEEEATEATYFSPAEIEDLPIPGIQRKFLRALEGEISKRNSKNLFDP